jgi:hypothetical protein
VSQKYEDGQANQAGCLNLLTNAVIVWNTVYMQAALDAIRREGYPVQEEDLAHLWPIRFAHIHRYGKYEFNVEAARMRAGLRPLIHAAANFASFFAFRALSIKERTFCFIVWK